MIKNFNNLSTKIYEVMESDGAAAMKITFKDSNVANDFTNDYLSTVLNPVWYNTYSDVVIITLTAEFGVYTASATLADILSFAAQDYDAKKIQLI